MNIKKFLISLAALIMIATSLSGLSKVNADNVTSPQVKKIKRAGVLKVGVKQDVPNFGYYNAETGKYEGMEIDIARKIAKSIGVKLELVPVTTQTREPLMDNGQVDLVIATYTITPERQASYSISKPYYYDQIGFLVRQSSTISKISYAKKHHLKFNYVQLGSFPELAISLYSKRIDAFSVDKSILTGYVSKQSKLLKSGFNTQEYGIATKKSNTGLTKYVNYLLKKWTADKSLESIYNKHNLESAKPDK